MSHVEVRYVEWVDSTAEHGWRPHDDRDPVQVSGCHTVGFVLRDTDELVELAQSVDSLNGNVAAVLAIPKVAITRQITVRTRGVRAPTLPGQEVRHDGQSAQPAT